MLKIVKTESVSFLQTYVLLQSDESFKLNFLIWDFEKEFKEYSKIELFC